MHQRCYRTSNIPTCSVVMPLATALTIQTLCAWNQPVLITIIFPSTGQRWAVCFSASCSPYLLRFPPMVIESGCRPVKVQSERVGVVEREKDRTRGGRRADFYSETCALFCNFTLCQQKTATDHWLLMRGHRHSLVTFCLLSFCEAAYF